MDRTLPKAEWTHAAHFAAALVLVARHGDADVRRIMPQIIRAYNEATGVANTDHGGYHETITLASIRAAARWLEASTEPTLAATCASLLAGPLGNSDWLLHYWTRARLFSVAARRAWCPPDAVPAAMFDF
jgi:hypothetical protein